MYFRILNTFNNGTAVFQRQYPALLGEVNSAIWLAGSGTPILGVARQLVRFGWTALDNNQRGFTKGDVRVDLHDSNSRHVAADGAFQARIHVAMTADTQSFTFSNKLAQLVNSKPGIVLATSSVLAPLGGGSKPGGKLGNYTTLTKILQGKSNVLSLLDNQYPQAGFLQKMLAKKWGADHVLSVGDLADASKKIEALAWKPDAVIMFSHYGGTTVRIPDLFWRTFRVDKYLEQIGKTTNHAPMIMAICEFGDTAFCGPQIHGWAAKTGGSWYVSDYTLVVTPNQGLKASNIPAFANVVDYNNQTNDAVFVEVK